MFYLFKQLQKCVSAFIVLTLIFNSTLQVLASSDALKNAQQYADETRMMICTGNSFKWISSTEYFETGSIVYVEAPQNNPDKASEIDCSFAHISDPQLYMASITSLDDGFIAYTAMVSVLAKRPYTSFAYQTSQSRAPPYA